MNNQRDVWIFGGNIWDSIIQKRVFPWSLRGIQQRTRKSHTLVVGPLSPWVESIVHLQWQTLNTSLRTSSWSARNLTCLPEEGHTSLKIKLQNLDTEQYEIHNILHPIKINYYTGFPNRKMWPITSEKSVNRNIINDTDEGINRSGILEALLQRYAIVCTDLDVWASCRMSYLSIAPMTHWIGGRTRGSSHAAISDRTCVPRRVGDRLWKFRHFFLQDL